MKLLILIALMSLPFLSHAANTCHISIPGLHDALERADVLEVQNKLNKKNYFLIEGSPEDGDYVFEDLLGEPKILNQYTNYIVPVGAETIWVNAGFLTNAKRLGCTVKNTAILTKIVSASEGKKRDVLSIPLSITVRAPNPSYCHSVAREITSKSIFAAIKTLPKCEKLIGNR